MFTLETKLFIDAILEMFDNISINWGWSVAIALFSAVIAFSVHLLVLHSFPRVKLYTPNFISPSKRSKGSKHVWVKGDTWLGAGEGPSYCNHCEEIVLHGVICIVCGCCAHKEHLEIVTSIACKYRINTDLPSGFNEGDHQWIKGNLPLHAECLNCEELSETIRDNSFILFERIRDAPKLNGFRCVWCSNCVHETCLESISKSEICPLSKISSKAIVHPSYITSMSRSRSNSVSGSSPRKFSWRSRSSKSIICADANKNAQPLLCIINPKAGAQNSIILLRNLYFLLNPCQILDLSQGKPKDIFDIFRPCLHQCRIMVCGGDGTVGWILSELDIYYEKMPKDEHGKPLSRPPVGILPLGTGNDLARVLEWGSGWRNEPVDFILQTAMEAEVVELDRWKIKIKAPEPPQTPTRSNLVQKAIKLSESLRTSKVYKELIMNNYLSLGLDASIALDFHKTREKTPHLFKSRTFNKVWYALFGGKRTFSNLLYRVGYSSSELDLTRLDTDANSTESSSSELNILSSPPSPAPPPHSPLMGSSLQMKSSTSQFDLSDAGGLIVLNIPSYAGGAQIHAIAESGGLPPVSMDDQKLEVFQLHNSLELAASIVSLTSPQVLGSCEDIKIHVPSPRLDMQVDGEPWIQEGPFVIHISFYGKATMLKSFK